MKKIIFLLIMIFCLSVFKVNAIELPKQTDHEIVTIYIFRGKDCSHCHDALLWFKDNITRYESYIEVKSYEVYQNKDNSLLASNVAKKMDKDLDGIPYIIVGDSYDQVGFKFADGEKIVKAALSEYENESYNDLVLDTLDGLSEAKVDTLEEACLLEGITNNNSNAVLATVIVSLMLVVSSLIFFIKK